MYLLFVNHHWSPTEYFDAHESDKILIRAFLRKQAEDAEKERDELNG